MHFYDFTLPTVDGGEKSMADQKGTVTLIVNTATGCGFTPQYEALEAIYEKYHDQGFEIFDVPCNQFGEQAPGTDAEISEFCTLNYNTTFPRFKKSDVNGENALPLYEYLKSKQGFKGFGDSEGGKMMTDWLTSLDPHFADNDDIKWNFTKFLVCDEGNIVARFEPTEDMAVVEAAVKKYVDWKNGIEPADEAASCSVGEACSCEK